MIGTEDPKHSIYSPDVAASHGRELMRSCGNSSNRSVDGAHPMDGLKTEMTPSEILPLFW